MKFTIRDLFLVTVIVAILTAWWVDRSRLEARFNGTIKKPFTIPPAPPISSSQKPNP